MVTRLTGKKRKSRSRSSSSSSSSSASNPASPKDKKSRSRKLSERSSSSKRDKSIEQSKGSEKEKSRSKSESSGKLEPEVKVKPVEEKWNLIHFDPEQHWCRPCNAFPQTAKEYLTHMHTPDHRKILQEQKLTELPWHEDGVHKEQEVRQGCLSKRVPIKGLQFFVAAPAWYCKLCRCWMGDLHCASLHLKSQEHDKNFLIFIEKNPTWETTWIGERERAQMTEQKTKTKLEEHLQLQKKLEEEMRLRMAAADLLIPLTLQTSKREKKKTKRSKKKKRRRSTDSSSSSSSSSSDEPVKKEKEKKTKKVKKEAKAKQKEVKVATPEKSKWESYDTDEEQVQKAPTPELDMNPILEAKMVSTSLRNYRWDGRPPRFQKPTSPFSSPYEIPKIPEKHSILIPESMKSKEETLTTPPLPKGPPPGQKPSVIGQKKRLDVPISPDDEPEARFDKQIAAAMKKPGPPALAKKTKFGFIGRMPFARRKAEVTDDSSKNNQDVATPDPTPPPPPLISKKAANLMPPPAIVSPVLTSKTKVEIAKEILTKSQTQLNSRRQDSMPMDPVLMDVDVDMKLADSPPNCAMPPTPPRIRPQLPPEVTRNLGKKTMAIPLPKEFQEALEIIYPEELPIVTSPPRLPMNPPPPPPNPPTKPSTLIGPLLPSKPALPPSNALPQRKVQPKAPPLPPAPPPIGPPPAPKIKIPEPPPPPSIPAAIPKVLDIFADQTMGMDDDDMALLGIDKEDMAAQRF